jgi:hypothetical protein
VPQGNGSRGARGSNARHRRFAAGRSIRHPREGGIVDSFTEDNDPHGEHDFGAFEHEGARIFWKIDYYAPDMEHGSENPADPKQTVRVLTIMLASEY